MKYRKDKNGNDLSVLGFGCMRFQKKRGKIDMAEAEREIMTAYNNGVNYFDTAFIYPGSEAAIGEIFEKNGIRENVYIATKLPPALMRSIDILDKLFNEQLKRLRTDYIDFYLFHMMADIKIWNRLKEMGIEQWIEEKKKAVQYVISPFPTTAIQICSVRLLTPMTGICALFSITIWMSTLRQAERDLTTPTKRAFPL